MRKINQIAAAVLLAALTLAGCGSGAQTSSSSPAPSTAQSGESTQAGTTATTPATSPAGAELEADLTLWTYPVGGFGDDAVVQELLADFNKKYPGIKVSVDYLTYADGDEVVERAVGEGTLPDIIMEGPERLVAGWGAWGLMVDLGDMFSASSAGDIYGNVRDACQSPDGSYYEYPLCMVAHCMAINKEMFEAADAMQYVDTETHTWTTENFFNAVQALYDSGIEEVGAVYCAGQGGDQGTRALVNNLYGGSYTDMSHTKFTVDTPENIRALKELYEQDGIVFDKTLLGGDELQKFREGDLAMSFCWNAMQQTNTEYSEAGKTVEGDTIIPMLFPSTDGMSTRLCGGIWGFGIFDNGDQAKIDAARVFIDFMCNDPEQSKKNVKAAGYFPVHANVSGVYTGTANDEVMEMFTANFMPAMGDYYQVVPGWAMARTEWWNMLQRIGDGGDAEAEVKTFNENANAATAE